MPIQVVHALSPVRIWTRQLTMPAGATIADAIRATGIGTDFPDTDWLAARVGIYGKLKSLDTLLREHDRVELYRPLKADPMESRRRRAAHKKTAG